MTELDPRVAAVAAAFRRMHSNVCYPEPSDSEAKRAAEEIIKAYLAAADAVQPPSGLRLEWRELQPDRDGLYLGDLLVAHTLCWNDGTWAAVALDSDGKRSFLSQRDTRGEAQKSAEAAVRALLEPGR